MNSAEGMSPRNPTPERSMRSLWRYPSKPSSMPDYMRRAFRMKCFALVTIQLLCLLGIKVLVDYYRPWELLFYGRLAYVSQEFFFYCSGSCTLLFIAAMQCLQQSYPCNYVMLSMATLMSGFFWGMLRARVLTTLHYQILGILIVTMAVATVLSRVALRFISMPLLCLLAPGWILGSGACALVVATMMERPDLEAMGIAAGLSMVQLIVMALDGGSYLKDCKPDDFMKVIVAMNSTLMVVVSIPFFVISFCFIHTSEVLQEDAHGTQTPPDGETA